MQNYLIMFYFQEFLSFNEDYFFIMDSCITLQFFLKKLKTQS